MAWHVHAELNCGSPLGGRQCLPHAGEHNTIPTDNLPDITSTNWGNRKFALLYRLVSLRRSSKFRNIDGAFQRANSKPAFGTNAIHKIFQCTSLATIILDVQVKQETWVNRDTTSVPSMTHPNSAQEQWSSIKAMPDSDGKIKCTGVDNFHLLMILPQVHLRKPCYDFYFL